MAPKHDGVGSVGPLLHSKSFSGQSVRPSTASEERPWKALSTFVGQKESEPALGVCQWTLTLGPALPRGRPIRLARPAPSSRLWSATPQARESRPACDRLLPPRCRAAADESAPNGQHRRRSRTVARDCESPAIRWWGWYEYDLNDA
ncbi:hypothetical protein ACCO45_000794 [Purpureocillium lilacinum]|uniref:Uncharacterized protein n=1 Tax=Purpureocillium lilacinum TaxID=33203 RepID=A0ACC4E571_PURLI